MVMISVGEVVLLIVIPESVRGNAHPRAALESRLTVAGH